MFGFRWIFAALAVAGLLTPPHALAGGCFHSGRRVRFVNQKQVVVQSGLEIVPFAIPVAVPVATVQTPQVFYGYGGGYGGGAHASPFSAGGQCTDAPGGRDAAPPAVLDGQAVSKCAGCHSGDNPASGFDITGPLTDAQYREVTRRSMLPQDHPDHMPPASKPQLKPEEVGGLFEYLVDRVLDDPGTGTGGGGAE